MNSICIVGNGTSIGKTHVSCLLLKHFNDQGYQTVGFKPFATGAKLTTEGWRADDALLLMEQSSIKFPYSFINPFCYKEESFPTVGMQANKKILDTHDLYQLNQMVWQQKAEFKLVETVGGICCPLTDKILQIDWLKTLNMPVILICGLYLGCINHSILTYEILRKHNIEVLGWISNEITKLMDYQQENIQALKQFISCEYLGHVNYGASTLNLKTSFFDEKVFC